MTANVTITNAEQPQSRRYISVQPVYANGQEVTPIVVKSGEAKEMNVHDGLSLTVKEITEQQALDILGDAEAKAAAAEEALATSNAAAGVPAGADTVGDQPKPAESPTVSEFQNPQTPDAGEPGTPAIEPASTAAATPVA